MSKIFDTKIFSDQTLYVSRSTNPKLPIIETLKENFASKSITRNAANDIERMRKIGELVRNHQEVVYTNELDNQIKNIIG